MSDLKLEIISPNGVLFSGNCYMAVVPSIAGDLGAMRDHETVIAALREGKIMIYDNKHNVVQSFDVKSGFAEMQGGEKLLVLLDS